MDEDDDSAISFREFLMIFRKARLGELDMESGLGKLATLSEVLKKNLKKKIKKKLKKKHSLRLMSTPSGLAAQRLSSKQR